MRSLHVEYGNVKNICVPLLVLSVTYFIARAYNSVVLLQGRGHAALPSQGILRTSYFVQHLAHYSHKVACQVKFLAQQHSRVMMWRRKLIYLSLIEGRGFFTFIYSKVFPVVLS